MLDGLFSVNFQMCGDVPTMRLGQAMVAQVQQRRRRISSSNIGVLKAMIGSSRDGLAFSRKDLPMSKPPIYGLTKSGRRKKWRRTRTYEIAHVAGYQLPRLAVATPRSSRASAICCSVVAPALRTCFVIGSTVPDRAPRELIGP